MNASSDLRMTKIPLNHGASHIPALGFGTLIPDAALTMTATRDALEAGFRHFDCAERYGNEREVGEALQAGAYHANSAPLVAFIGSMLSRIAWSMIGLWHLGLVTSLRARPAMLILCFLSKLSYPAI